MRWVSSLSKEVGDDNQITMSFLHTCSGVYRINSIIVTKRDLIGGHQQAFTIARARQLETLTPGPKYGIILVFVLAKRW